MAFTHQRITSPQNHMSQTPVVSTRKDLKTMLDTHYKSRLQDILRDRAPQFAAALVQVVNRSYYLQKCKPESIIGAAITAAALDLSFDPNLGEAHLVPYGDQCTFQIGYKGLTQLAQRSAQYRRLGWMIVYEGQMEYWNPLTGELRLDVTNKQSDKIEGYAAYFQLLNGFERSEYWTQSEVMQHAGRYSQAYKKDKKDSPWFTNLDRMALKTVLMALIRPWGPKSVQMQQAMSQDNTIRKTVSGETEPVFDLEDPINGQEHPPTLPQSDAPAELAGTTSEPGKPAEQPASEQGAPPKEKVGVSTDELAKIVIDAGFTWEEFAVWAKKEGHLPEADSLPGFSDVGTQIAKRLVRARIGLVQGLNNARGQ